MTSQDQNAYDPRPVVFNGERPKADEGFLTESREAFLARVAQCANERRTNPALYTLKVG